MVSTGSRVRIPLRASGRSITRTGTGESTKRCRRIPRGLRFRDAVPGRGAVDHYAVATGRLRPVQRPIGPLDEVFGQLGALPARHPGGARLLEWSDGAKPLDHPLCLLDVAVREQDHELLAPDTGQEVPRAKGFPPVIRCGAEERVARGMTELVVEGLEAVEVDHCRPQREPLPVGSGDLPHQLMAKPTAVGKACQLV